MERRKILNKIQRDVYNTNNFSSSPKPKSDIQILAIQHQKVMAQFEKDPKRK